jgi:hypothetical protein
MWTWYVHLVFLIHGKLSFLSGVMFLVGASAVAATTDGRLLRRKEGKEGGGGGIAFVLVPWRHRPLTLLPKSSSSSSSSLSFPAYIFTE